MTNDDQSPPLIGRRQLLATISAGSLAVVAGCGSTGENEQAGNGTAGTSTPGTQTPGESDSTQDNATIEAPDAARIDQEIAPTLSGLPPGERVTVEANTSIQGQNGPVDWSASATFEADKDGAVSLDTQAPVDGSYESNDPMGLFWSMETDLDPARAFFPLRPHDVTLTVTGEDDSVLAEATTERSMPSVERESLGEDLAGTIHYPPSGESGPGIVLLHGSQPRELTGAARLFAAHGYVAASLQYFGEPEPVPASLVEVPVEYVERACSTLAANDRVTGEQVGLYGASKGGELALLAGAESDRVGAVVSISGSGVVWEGIESLGESPGQSSWSLDGEPVPYVPYPDRDPNFSNGRKYYDDGFDAADAETVAAATIPVEQIDGPVTLVAGGADKLSNSVRFGNIAINRLGRTDFAHEFGQRVYDDAGHSITPPVTPTYGSTEAGPLVLGGSPAANARASREHWPHVLSTFDSLVAE